MTGVQTCALPISHGDDDCAAIMSMFAAIDATVNATFNLQQDGDGVVLQVWMSTIDSYF